MDTEIRVKTITDNAEERLAIKWDGERFSLVHYDRIQDKARAILLNPKEMIEIVNFAGVLGGK